MKRIDFTKPSFMANGKEYFINGQLSIARFAEFQILELELGLSISFKKLNDELKELDEGISKLKIHELTVEDLYKIQKRTRDLRTGVLKLQEKEHGALKLCALFMNTKDEDDTIWSNDLAVQKINDWKAEGYSMDDFFWQALNSVNGYLTTYREMSQRISGKTETTEQD